MEDISELKKILGERIEAVKSQIDDCVRDSGRAPGDVTLIGVSKVFPWEYAAAAFSAGLADLGENKVQDLTAKIDKLHEEGLDPRWHMIGTLQKNKVKYLIGKTYLIHSVNTIELAQEISKRSACNNVTTDILIQANVSGEESKHGFAPDELKMAVDTIGAMDGINIRGLMTMAPIEQYEGQARKVFSDTYNIYSNLINYVPDRSMWNILSMGMSQDFRDAILEGATHVRIGTSIFGDRNQFLSREA